MTLSVLRYLPFSNVPEWMDNNNIAYDCIYDDVKCRLAVESLLQARETVLNLNFDAFNFVVSLFN